MLLPVAVLFCKHDMLLESTYPDKGGLEFPIRAAMSVSFVYLLTFWDLNATFTIICQRNVSLVGR